MATKLVSRIELIVITGVVGALTKVVKSGPTEDVPPVPFIAVTIIL